MWPQLLIPAMVAKDCAKNAKWKLKGWLRLRLEILFPLHHMEQAKSSDAHSHLVPVPGGGSAGLVHLAPCGVFLHRLDGSSSCGSTESIQSDATEHSEA